MTHLPEFILRLITKLIFLKFGVQHCDDRVVILVELLCCVNICSPFEVMTLIARTDRSYGTVSYYVQQLFAQHQGVRYLDTRLHSTYPPESVAASTTCSDEDCSRITIKARFPERPMQCTFGGKATKTTYTGLWHSLGQHRPICV